MLTIRLSRHGRKKIPFYRVVLTEHTKPVKTGYKDVLGWYDPMKHALEVDINRIKEWIAKGAMLSERLAKLLYQQTKDALFQKFFIQRERHGKTRKEEKK